MTAVKPAENPWEFQKCDFTPIKSSKGPVVFFEYNKTRSVIHVAFEDVFCGFLGRINAIGRVALLSKAEQNFALDFTKLLIIESDKKSKKEIGFPKIQVRVHEKRVVIENPTFFREFVNLESMVNLAAKNRMRMVKMIFRAISEYFKPLPPTIQDLSSKEYILTSTHEISCIFLKHVGFSAERVTYDFNAFGMGKEQAKADPEKISSFAFALMKARVIKAADFIFNYTDDDNDTVSNTIFELFPKWGLNLTGTPQPNDIVAYAHRESQGNKHVLMVNHLGILMSDGRVWSKFGIDNPYAYLHPICDHPYGSSLLFFTAVGNKSKVETKENKNKKYRKL